jgi:hypothetical protein
MVGVFYMGLAAAPVVFVGSPLVVFQLMLETCTERARNDRSCVAGAAHSGGLPGAELAPVSAR